MEVKMEVWRHTQVVARGHRAPNAFGLAFGLLAILILPACGKQDASPSAPVAAAQPASPGGVASRPAPKDQLTVMYEAAQKFSNVDGICQNLFNGVANGYRSRNAHMMKIFIEKMEEHYCFVNQEVLDRWYEMARNGARRSPVCNGQFQIVHGAYHNMPAMRAKVEMMLAALERMERFGCVSF